MPLEALFAEAGPLARGYHAVDWARTPLGPPAGWSPALRAALASCLGAPAPALLVWGPERVVLPNAAARDLLGDDAPAPGAVGARWGPPFLRALLEAAAAHDRGASLPDRPFVRARGEAREEVHVRCGCAPVREADGARVGLHVALEDATPRVLAERRAATLAALAALEGAPDEVLAGACAALVAGAVGVASALAASADGAAAGQAGAPLAGALAAARARSRAPRRRPRRSRCPSSRPATRGRPPPSRSASTGCARSTAASAPSSTPPRG
ncbi:MAG: hypothetical protein M9894_04500 [Planctomycetes bacterium]|nr:hypothetical protein [Planctomycetota bacterium]